ncbi:MAG: type II secretion system protein [Candidatus Parcubacteria bacterium]|nr:type II secretion system protein [Candidatus Parcubacteria bacterium]
MKIGNTKNKGFTLIELLVVIAIIGLLATVVSVNVGGSKGKARDARRLEDLSQLRLVLEMYHIQNEFYPWDGTVACDLISVNGQSDPLTAVLVGGGFMSDGITDPEIASGCVYYYGTPSWWWSCSKSYQLEMRFETKQGAAQAAKAGGECWDYSGEYNWGSGVCAGYNCAFSPP